MNIEELQNMTMKDLRKIAKDMKVQGYSGLKKQELICEMIKNENVDAEEIRGKGVLEILPDGFGFLRSPKYNYLSGPDDIYLAPSQIKRFSLRKGDTISGMIRPPKS